MNINRHTSALHQVSVAPMLDWTDRHCRYFHRLLSPNVLLYTEMVTTGALLHGDRNRFLQFNNEEHPIALQLGGSEKHDLAECCKMAQDYGYDEINLNCGCPSERVQKGQFGAVLMENPNLVARCIEAMRKATVLPVTVKCRIGIDEQDSFEFLDNFISIVKQAGCNHFIIHARKCWLSGLSPKENRSVPPINYARAAEIKSNHPDIAVTVNGEIKAVTQIKELLNTFDAVMIGREIYQNPYILKYIEKEIFRTPEDKLITRQQAARDMIPYIEKQLKEGARINSVTRHMMGLFKGQRGGRHWRQILSTLPHKEGITPGQVIEEGLMFTSLNKNVL